MMAPRSPFVVIAMKSSRPQSLERLLQSQGFGSRKECRQLIALGRVAVNGEVIDDARTEFLPEPSLCLTVDDADWLWRDKLYLALYKPAGYECSHAPQHHRPVFSLLPRHFVQRGVQAAGRLDADTTGLLLLSDDGPWLHSLASPRRHVSKTYEVHTRHPVSAELIAALLAGVQLHDEPAPLAALACHQLDTHRLSMTIDQGKYHQVKRMVAAASNRVDALHRVGIGALRLDHTPLSALQPGQWQELDATQLAALHEA
ncbi:pseudouridine synthase [Parachitinimonas caeni]|uniref:Pseudouridine synthase n=1 Tax=Parachitinimonas caeni TaxID=3031301 RepID=A0ABT7E2Q8_9NEIS|nr:16S rRNA pseudouridine(516) synthase [Parachitinimonas caeni]MDK2126606.1 16S rRNA pseudouridine(516) synthase [Parachitinimonas caeni]